MALDCSALPLLAATAQPAVICIAPAAFSWISLAAPAVGAFGLFFAWRSIDNARAIARLKATLDMIEKVESTEHYRGLHKSFSTIRKSAEGFAPLHDPAMPAAIRARQDVIDYLNHYELVALGVRNEILDAAIYRGWMLGAFVRDWNAASGWIQRERWKQRADGGWEYNRRIFEHYQWAACEWSNDAVRLTEHSSPPPATAGGPGDEPLPEPAPG